MRSKTRCLQTSLLLGLGVLVAAGAAPLAAAGPDFGLPDYDIRAPRATTLPAPDRVLPPGQQRKLDELRDSAEGDLVVRWSPLTGAPSRLYRRGRPLTLPAQAAPQAVVSTFFAQYRELFNLTPRDVQEIRYSRNFRSQQNGVQHFTLQQRFNDIDVFQGSLRVNVDGEGRILNLSGEPMPEVAYKVNSDSPSLDEKDATHYAAAATGISRQRSSRVEGLVYFPRDANTLRLAWRVYIEDADSANGYDVLVDAMDGTLLWRKNRTLYDHIPAHGFVWPSDSPQPDTPKGTLFNDVQVDAPFNGGLLFPHGDPHYDWWAGVTPRDTTTNNNVDAFLDRDNDDAPDGSCTSCGDGAARPDAGAGEDFTFALANPETFDPSLYQDAAITNTFYWANRAHDFFYRLGFDEAAGNFQNDNFTFAGVAGDRVLLNVQDGADLAEPPYCNANMNTQADGISPRLQMYLCDNTTPIRDAALDAGTLMHEYSHGVHSRLLSLSGRQNPQEGISDYFALSHLSEVGDPYSGAYGYGGSWARGITDGDGIRSAPYSTDNSIFTRTYADINDASRCNLGTCSVTSATNCTESSDCPSGESCQKTVCSFDEDCGSPPLDIPRGPCTVSVHRTGEIWANALWIARFNLVEKFGFGPGSRAMNRLVIDGMKLSADDPSMLDGRDAILAADLATNGGAYSCLIWDAFARMGMGVSALTTGNDDLNPLEAFDVPASCSPVMEIHAPANFGNVCISEFEEKTLTVYNTGAGDLAITSVSRTAGSTDIEVDPLPSTPIFLGPDSHIDFTVRCTPTTTGPLTATITVETNDAVTPEFDVVYSCNGGQPDLDTALLNNLSYDNVCIGDIRTQSVVIHNSGTCPLVVDAISSSSVDFQVGAVGTLPLTIASGNNIEVPIEFQPTGATGAKGATLSIDTNDVDVDLGLTGTAPPADIESFIADSGSFGNVCADTFHDLMLTIQNNGVCPLDVTGVSLVGGDLADFSLPTGFTPVVLEALNSVQMPVRFQPTSFAAPTARSTTARVTSRTAYSTDATSDDDTAISGNVPPPNINVPANGPDAIDVQFGNVCGGVTSDINIPVCNTGLCTLNVTAAYLEAIGGGGACDDFTIVQNPFPDLVSHDFCMDIVVRYTPQDEGTHQCQLVIESDSPGESPIIIGLEGTTPTTMIDIPGDMSFSPEVVNQVDECSTLQPFPVSNNGLCPLKINSMTITEDLLPSDPDAEFLLDGVPSLPTYLQSGHVFGAGDLDVEFKPWEPLERWKVGVLTVNYDTDQVAGDPLDVPVYLCGEGTYTGARVLVTDTSGDAFSTVERIQIQRITANRNRRPRLDTVSVLRNVPLTTVTPPGGAEYTACQEFEYHAEYGTVSNGNQLLPGVYQVNATVRIGGRRYTKSVGFSVNACDFNPTVIITF